MKREPGFGDSGRPARHWSHSSSPSHSSHVLTLKLSNSQTLKLPVKSRIGKVARLPKPIRDELNHRLDNGADGPELLAWLNALPEVQKVLAKKFNGRPLTKHNLSDWRRGGYADWADTHDGRLQWQDLIERGLELNQDGADLSSHLATILIAELAGALQELRAIEDSEQRWKILQRISRSLSRLRMDNCREKQLDLRDAMEQRRSRQIAPSRPESPSKNFSFLP